MATKARYVVVKLVVHSFMDPDRDTRTPTDTRYNQTIVLALDDKGEASIKREEVGIHAVPGSSEIRLSILSVF